MVVPPAGSVLHVPETTTSDNNGRRDDDDGSSFAGPGQTQGRGQTASSSGGWLPSAVAGRGGGSGSSDPVDGDGNETGVCNIERRITF